uniref:Uncharacterized protein n=1 Tax=Timema tahoe TaxID=61484 RepID=A0A7R9ITF7_9NEOP|nr:unnamed protein product [Timema tahoe]
MKRTISNINNSCSIYALEINEPDYHAIQVKLESTIEPVLQSIVKPDSGVFEELDFKEELCFDESSINVSEKNKIELGQNFNNEPNLYEKIREKYKCHDYTHYDYENVSKLETYPFSQLGQSGRDNYSTKLQYVRFTTVNIDRTTLNVEN